MLYMFCMALVWSFEKLCTCDSSSKGDNDNHSSHMLDSDSDGRGDAEAEAEEEEEEEDREVLPVQELLGFQFKNVVVAMAVLDVFNGSWQSTFSAATVALLLFCFFICLSRSIRRACRSSITLEDVNAGLRDSVHHHFEQSLREMELDGAGLACGYAINMAVQVSYLSNRLCFRSFHLLLLTGFTLFVLPP